MVNPEDHFDKKFENRVNPLPTENYPKGKVIRSNMSKIKKKNILNNKKQKRNPRHTSSSGSGKRIEI